MTLKKMLGCGLALLTLGQPLRAAVPQEPEPNPYKIDVNVGLVDLPVTVMDRNHHHVPGLEKKNFEVMEDGKPRAITLFENGDVPVTAGLLVDNSLSMQPVRPSVVAATEEFAEISNPDDDLFIVEFNQSGRLNFSQDTSLIRKPKELGAILSRSKAAGRTALYDAIAAGLEHLGNRSPGKKYLIVVSDGGDNASHHSRSQTLDSARKSSVVIYSVAVLNNLFSDQDPGFLKKLSRVSGGQYYAPASVPEIVSALKSIANDIRQQYALGFTPENQDEVGKFHQVRVIVSAPGKGKLTVRTREGFLVPAKESSEAK